MTLAPSGPAASAACCKGSLLSTDHIMWFVLHIRYSIVPPLNAQLLQFANRPGTACLACRYGEARMQNFLRAGTMLPPGCAKGRLTCSEVLQANADYYQHFY